MGPIYVEIIAAHGGSGASCAGGVFIQRLLGEKPRQSPCCWGFFVWEIDGTQRAIVLRRKGG
jgi:hypothetical protein